MQQYKRVVEGVADITFGLQAYTPTIFPKTMLIIPPGKATNALEATERLLAVYDTHLADEYKDVKLLGIFTVAGNAWAATGDYSTLESLAGTKMVSLCGDDHALGRGHGGCARADAGDRDVHGPFDRHHRQHHRHL